MEPSSGFDPAPSILVVMSDPHLRQTILDACGCAPINVVAVSRIGHVERWPTGDIVVTDLQHLTPFWAEVGAMHVLAVVDDVRDGPEALERGATGWLLAEHSGPALATLAVMLGSANRAA